MATSNSPQSGIYIQQHAGRNATMHLDAGSVIRPSILGTLPLDFYTAKGMTTTTGIGAIVTSGTAPGLHKISTSPNAPITLDWASGVAGAASGVRFTAIPVPADYDPETTATLHLYGKQTPSADASGGLIASIFWGVTSTGDLGSSGAAFTTLPSDKTIPIASGQSTAGFISVGLYADTHAANTINLYGAWISYTRKL